MLMQGESSNSMSAGPLGREAKTEMIRKEIHMFFLPFVLKQVGVLAQSRIIGKGINSLLAGFQNSEKVKVI